MTGISPEGRVRGAIKIDSKIADCGFHLPGPGGTAPRRRDPVPLNQATQSSQGGEFSVASGLLPLSSSVQW